MTEGTKVVHASVVIGGMVYQAEHLVGWLIPAWVHDGTIAVICFLW